MLQTKKPRKGKASPKGGKKPVAQGGSKGKGKRNPRKRPGKKGAKKNFNDSKDKEEPKKADNKSSDSCKSVTNEFFTFSHPSSHGSCGCGLSNDITVSSIA